MRSMTATVIATAGALFAVSVGSALGEKLYGPGVSDTEIKIGQTMPYSGPASSFSIIGRIELAYLKMINSQGGVNGRKVNLLSLDDGYSPPKAVEQIRKLVESEEVLAIFSMLGTAPNLAVAKYLNARGVPQLFSLSGSPLLDDPKTYPLTFTFFTSQRVEAHVFASYILKHSPDARLAILYQDDEYGRGYVRYLKEGLGDKAATMIVKEAAYSVTDPTIDSQMATLKASGADTLFTAATPKFAAQAIRKRYDMGWQATHYMISAASSLDGTIRPAGVQQATGVITTAFLKSPDDPAWANDPGMQAYFNFMKNWAPGEPINDQSSVYAMALGEQLVELIKRCGDDLSRENVMKQALSVNRVQLPQYVPGVLVTLSPEYHSPVHTAKMMRFDGERWEMSEELVESGF